MKLISISVTILLLTAFIFSGCVDNAVNNSENGTKGFSNDETSLFVNSEEVRQILHSDFEFMPDVLSRGLKASLNKLYADNSIDSYFYASSSECETTADMVTLANEYCSLWKKEMESEAEKLTGFFDEEAANSFALSQDLWEQTRRENLKWQTKALMGDGNASELSYKITLYEAVLFKNRAFEIKCFRLYTDANCDALILQYDSISE